MPTMGDLPCGLRDGCSRFAGAACGHGSCAAGAAAATGPVARELRQIGAPRPYALDDRTLPSASGDLEFRSIRLGHQINEGLEFSQIHGSSATISKQGANLPQIRPSSALAHIFQRRRHGIRFLHFSDDKSNAHSLYLLRFARSSLESWPILRCLICPWRRRVP